MRKTTAIQALVLLAAVWTPLAKAANWYVATRAYEAKELTQAFEMFRELAELGLPRAQETLAIMYVNAEGVPRGNVQGYAWAKIAKENGSTEVQAIIDQLEPHMSANSRRIADELHAKFGAEAVRKRLLPDMSEPQAYKNRVRCRLTKGSSGFYPQTAKSRGIQGNTFVEVTIGVDDRARNPRVLYSVPPGEFEEAAIRTLLTSEFLSGEENGIKVPCRLTVAMRFVMPEYESEDYPKLDIYVERTRAAAEAGDASSQLLYGLLIAGLPQLRMSSFEAIPWYAKAAQAGMPLAQFLVGSAIAEGAGPVRDEAKGLFWLNKAADAGQPDAQLALARRLLSGTPDAAQSAEALGLIEKAAASGNRDGKFYLAAVLAAGKDAARRDPQRALSILKEVMFDVDSDPTAFEIRAAAAAMLGNFPDAIRDQQKAMRMAEKLKWQTGPQRERLAYYVAGKPWIGDLFAF